MKTKASYFKTFKDITTVISFLTGLITLASTLLALNLPNVDLKIIFTDILITDPYLFSYWIIILFTYIALLHTYWEKNKQKFSADFVDFLYSIFTAPYPGLILPFVILLVLFFLTITPQITIPLAVVWYIILSVYYYDDRRLIKRRIKYNWPEISKRIEVELDRYQWVSTDDLRDLATQWNADHWKLTLLLVEYSVKNPDKVLYKSVFNRKTRELVEADVLISLKSFDNSKYYY